MRRTVVGIIVGVLLIFPGAEAIRFFASDLTGLYTDMTLTEAFLALIVLLLTILLFRGVNLGGPAVTQGPIIIEPKRRSSERRSEPRAEAPSSREPRQTKSSLRRRSMPSEPRTSRRTTKPRREDPRTRRR